MKQIGLLLTLLTISTLAFTQVDTLSYPEDRKAIWALIRQPQRAAPIDCSDFIAVGPKGDISFSRQQWIENQQKLKLTFKSLRIVDGTAFIRIYDGTTAVVNFLAAVELIVDKKNVQLKVRRLEVYHKSNGQWCRVAGQGTEVDEQLFPVQ